MDVAPPPPPSSLLLPSAASETSSDILDGDDYDLLQQDLQPEIVFDTSMMDADPKGSDDDQDPGAVPFHGFSSSPFSSSEEEESSWPRSGPEVELPELMDLAYSPGTVNYRLVPAPEAPPPPPPNPDPAESLKKVLGPGITLTAKVPPKEKPPPVSADSVTASITPVAPKPKAPAPATPGSVSSSSGRLVIPSAKISAAISVPSPPLRRETREWRPSGLLFKPLKAGWVREVIYNQNEDGSYSHDSPPEIIYHAPVPYGTKPKQFTNLSEMSSYLTNKDSTLTWHNFSFRKEVMGAIPGQEVVRGRDEKVDLFPNREPPPAPAEKVKPSSASKPNAGGSKASPAPTGLKVKMFSKMKERNSLAGTSSEDPIDLPSNAPLASTIPGPGEPLQEDVEDFDLPTPNPPPGRRVSQGRKRPYMATIGKGGTAAAAPNSSSSASNSPNPAMMGASSIADGVSPPRASWGTTTGASSSPSSNASPSTTTAGQKQILRPTLSNPVNCSIHCPGVQGFPSLSCTSCQSMFHPTCVGLVEGVDYERNYAFYCNACQPPPQGKENSNPFPAANARPSSSSSSTAAGSFGRGGRRPSYESSRPGNSSKGSSSGAAAPPRRPSQHQIHPNPPMLNGGDHLTMNGSGGKTPTPPPPLRPIEAQTIVNIGGLKYLVVPQPQQRKPVQPPTNNQKAKGNEKLPFLLRPQLGSTPDSMPTFEVEETVDGKLLLIPTTGPLKKGENPFPASASKSRSSSQEDLQPPSKQAKLSSSSRDTGSNGKFFSANLSAGYAAMMQVFKYLSTKERLKAARVCKLWKDIALNPVLWKSVSLKNCRVESWPSFADFLNRTQVGKLDMKKMLMMTPATVAASPSKGGSSKAALLSEDAWKDILETWPQLRHLTRVEFPRIPSTVLCKLVSASSDHLVSCLAGNIFPRELNLSGLTGMKKLRELKLKTAAGKMKLTGDLQSLEGLAHSLTKLSLLSLESLTLGNLEHISQLSSLEHLELGDCAELSLNHSNFLNKFASFQSLRSLRLEGAHLGNNLGDLRWLTKLETLELIDVHLKEGFGDGLVKLQTVKHLLLIPVYKDEVAAINAEIVDASMSLHCLTHFFLGLTNEWLESMSTLMHAKNNGGGGAQPQQQQSQQKDSFPILVHGVCEMYSLNKVFKTLSAAMPSAKVKILKMSRASTMKQFVETLKVK